MKIAILNPKKLLKFKSLKIQLKSLILSRFNKQNPQKYLKKYKNLAIIQFLSKSQKL